MIQATLRVVEKHTPAADFCDGVDSILRTRSDDVKEHSIQMRNEFLDQWGSLSATSRVVLLSATNRPWAIDEAFLSRLQRQRHGSLGPTNEAKYNCAVDIISLGAAHHMKSVPLSSKGGRRY